MAMLAEPRRKQKVINLRAKNNAWSNDTNKFGQRMLEKMGWTTGKGLGAKENGIVEHVIAKYKNDDKGLGYEDKNDQWTKHDDDFNALLANLSNDKIDEKKEVLHSGVSLEVKSKKSKARIHYHKFTRGKDLSRYSEKDLANIFGKKSFKEEKCVENVEKEEIKSTEQVFTEKGSMEDYFKCKMAALKAQNNMSNCDIDESNNSTDYVLQGFSTINDDDNIVEKKDTFSFYNNSKTNSEENLIQETQIEEKLSKKSKKKKSKKEKANEATDFDFQQFSDECDNTSTLLCNTQKEIPVIDTELPLSKKSKKKKKNKEFFEPQCEIIDDLNKTDKNKKRSKKKMTEIIDNSEISEQNSTDYVPKKKKNKNKDL